MAQKAFTESVEAATIALTNGGANSDEKLLKNRDLRVKGLDVVTGTTTVTVQLTFASSVVADYVIFGNLNTDDDVGITVEYNDGAWQSWGSAGPATYTNSNKYIGLSSQTRTLYRFQFTRAAGSTLELSCIFFGTEYDFPVSYQMAADRGSFVVNDVVLDAHGYPYGLSLDTSKKLLWDMTYRLTGTQKTALETDLLNVNYNQKPFFFTDTNVDTNYYLVRKEDAELPGVNIAKDFYEVPLRLVGL